MFVFFISFIIIYLSYFTSLTYILCFQIKGIIIIQKMKGRNHDIYILLPHALLTNEYLD